MRPFITSHDFVKVNVFLFFIFFFLFTILIIFIYQSSRKLNAMHQCVVKHTEKCEDPTPANILDSLIIQVLKVTPCWQTSGAETVASQSQYLLSDTLTLMAAALTAANILL